MDHIIIDEIAQAFIEGRKPRFTTSMVNYITKKMSDV